MVVLRAAACGWYRSFIQEWTGPQLILRVTAAEHRPTSQKRLEARAGGCHPPVSAHLYFVCTPPRTPSRTPSNKLGVVWGRSPLRFC